MDCHQLWVFHSVSLSLPELSISSGREELRKVSEEEGGKDLEEKLRQGHLLPQVTMCCFAKTPPRCQTTGSMANTYSQYTLQNEVVGLVERLLTNGESNKG